LNDGGKFTVGDFEAIPWAFSAGYFVAVIVFTYVLYAADKSYARSGAWRIPENILHIAELMGGWPGGFIAQRRLRHKCSKAGYLIAFWAIVFVHQVVALDFILDGALGRKAVMVFSKFWQGA
jgi:uncharacterized membrane protein YsdA (DUF1294 family)